MIFCKRTKKYFSRVALFLSIFFVLTPVELAFAQTTGNIQNNGTVPGKPLYVDPNTGKTVYQANGTVGTDGQYQGAGSAIASGAATCSVGQILSNLVSSTVSGAIGSIKGSLTSKATGAVTGAVTGIATQKVPVIATETNDRIDTNNEDQARFVSAKVGGAKGQSLLGGLLSGVGDVSWDSIAYCVANEMIAYIGNSTIQWINSGFKGNPVFVDNPEKYFEGIADREAGSFIQGVVGGTTGFNVCAPFKVQLAIDTLGNYNGTRGGGLGCTLSRIQNNYEKFAGGDWNAGGTPGWFELIQPQNNYYGASIIAQRELNSRIMSQQNTATVELNWARGYRNFKVCDGTTDPDTGKCSQPERTTTLGGYIENAVNVRGASPQHRLEIATQFDQIVSALVNQLIKIAVNKAFEKDGADSNN